MSWFESPTILVAVVAIIGIATATVSSFVTVVWMLGRWMRTVDQRLKTIEEALAGFAEWQRNVDERLRRFEQYLKGFEQRLKESGELLEQLRR